MTLLPLPDPVRSAVALGVLATSFLLLHSPASASAVPASVAVAVAAPSTSSRWSWPLSPPIVLAAPFRAPATAYGPGHRGIDLAADRGDAVTAPAGGVVSFAGPVAGREVVAIDHGDGVMSSFEPVAASVGVGDAVTRGDPIGRVATGGHCDAACVHVGVRRDGAYVSPLLFLGGVPRAVLLPMGG